jgi:hypothetical protein
MFIEGPASCDHRFGVYGAKAECPQCRAAGLCRILYTDFREHLPSPHSVELALMKSSIGTDTVSFPLLRDT